MIYSLKLRFPEDCVLDPGAIDAEVINYYDQPDGTTTGLVTLLNSRRDRGGAHFWRLADGSCGIEFSARVLDTDYLRGISENTIEQAAAHIGKVNGLRLDLHSLLRFARVYRADIAAGVKVDPFAAVSAAKGILTWPRKQQDFRYADSVLFYNSTEEINFYDKQAELRHTAPDLYAKIASEVDGTTRIEYRAKRCYALSREFKQDFEIDWQANKNPEKNPAVFLETVLDRRAQKRILLDRFDSLKLQKNAGAVDVKSIDWIIQNVNEGKVTLAKLHSLLGRKFVWDACGQDEAVVHGLLKAIGAKNPREMRKRYREAGAIVDPRGRSAIDIIQTVREKLEEIAA